MSDTCICLNERGQIAAGIYHETLWDGFSAWFDKLAEEALAKGWGTPECAKEEVSVQPMGYETSQRIMVAYIPEATASKPGRPKAGHSMFISVYRMPSGRYEFTAYNS